MNIKIVYILVIGMLFSSTVLYAKSVAGVVIPETTTLDNGVTLKLNGAGVRSKFFFKIYVAALYLPVSSSISDEIYAMSGEKRVLMHFIYDGVSKEKLVDAWNAGFNNNLSPTELNKLSGDINKFNSVFLMAKKDDQIMLDFIPSIGTQVWINGNLKITIQNKDFYTALLKIWLGDKPAERSLKKAMLNR